MLERFNYHPSQNIWGEQFLRSTKGLNDWVSLSKRLGNRHNHISQEAGTSECREATETTTDCYPSENLVDLCFAAKLSTTLIWSNPTTAVKIALFAILTLHTAKRIVRLTDWSKDYSTGAISLLTALKGSIEYARRTVNSLFSEEQVRDFWWTYLNCATDLTAELERDTRSAGSAEILFERESGAGHPAAGGEAREDIAVPLTSGSGESRPGRRMEDDWNIVTGALQSHSKRHGHAMSTQQAVEAGHIISHALGCPTSTGRNDPNGETFVIQDVRGRRDKRQNGIGISEGGPCYSLTKVDRHAVAFAENQRGELRTSAIAPQLSAGGGKPGSGYSAVCVNALSPVRGGPDDNDAQGNHLVSSEIDSHRMRTFTGLPSGMDSPRYRALGNAVTASVAYWIAKRILKYA